MQTNLHRLRRYLLAWHRTSDLVLSAQIYIQKIYTQFRINFLFMHGPLNGELNSQFLDQEFSNCSRVDCGLLGFFRFPTGCLKFLVIECFSFCLRLEFCASAISYIPFVTTCVLFYLVMIFWLDVFCSGCSW